MEIPRERRILLDWAANTDPGPLTEDERKVYKQLLQHFIEKADAGDTKLQFDLGVKFLDGIFVPCDVATAIRWWERAVGGGNIDAMTSLSGLYWLGEGGIKQDLRRAFDLMGKAAEQGSAIGQYELARMYQRGLGTAKDLSCAVRWFHAAASNNEETKRYLKSYRERIGPADTLVKVPLLCEHDVKAVAQYEVAEALAKGRGIEKDLSLAREWYEAAANRGHGLAQCELGMFLAQGIGGRDMASAVSWWKAAARNGVGQAALNAAVAYSSGDGVLQDIEKSKEWALVAAEAGFVEAFVHLGNLELENAESVKTLQAARKWFVRAAKADDLGGQYSVGLSCHRLGSMILKLDQENHGAAIAYYKEALLWFYLAAENGSEDAPEMISFLEKGLGPDGVRLVKEYEPTFRQIVSDDESESISDDGLTRIFWALVLK